MKEVSFIKINAEKWKNLEQELNRKSIKDPDRLAALYLELADDLAYAKTNYPDSKTLHYLNGLLSSIHQLIYKNKKEKKGRLINFWAKELPLLMADHQKQLFYAFAIFFISVAIGIVSSAYDDSFVRLILGEEYIDMTLENIKNDDPMAVYKKMHQTDMFLGITLNNIKVSFIAFAYGVLLSFGTGYILSFNGIMLGSFQYFFYTKGLLMTSALTIWIHGTLEISAIVIAGCAGLVMGNSILFPGTFSRMESFKSGAKRGLKIVIGVLPIFIVAGFLESFVTRLTHWPILPKAAIIFASAIFIIFYFIIYPKFLKKRLYGTR